MIETISEFFSSVVGILQTGINGFVDAVAAVFNGADAAGGEG